MKHTLNILLLILTFISCKNKSNFELKTEKTEVEKLEFQKAEKVDSIMNENSSNSEVANYVPTELEIQKNLPKFVNNAKIPDSLKIVYDEIIFGDFNGDEKEDFASTLINLENGYFGVLVIHNNKKTDYSIFGAGKEINGMKNLDWIEGIKTIPKGQVISPTIVDEETGDIIEQDKKQNFKLIGNGIYLSIEESHGGGIIFWNGKEYKWYHIE
ncbi:hypothetical protein [Gaetbulibacter jejuensis]|uniref:Uncharacterized protein n=1 Tax=Gaetbulibacter jejuensis TaxID=584607 RepID=A0ABN1JWF8_9FLAO